MLIFCLDAKSDFDPFNKEIYSEFILILVFLKQYMKYIFLFISFDLIYIYFH